jgi:hypothetical protein
MYGPEPSITAPCPPNMLRPASGATIARVTPAERLTDPATASGLIAGGHVDCRTERRGVGAGVVAGVGRVDLDETHAGEARDQPGGNVVAGGIHAPRIARDGNSRPAATMRPSRITTAYVLDRRGTVADNHARIGDGHCLCTGLEADESTDASRR